MPAPISSPIADLFEQLGPLGLEGLPDLRRYLAWVPDPRGRRGRWYSLECLLAICACAVLAGVTTVEGVGEWARNAPSEIRAALRIRRHPLGWRQVPSRRCLTGLLARIDADALDRAVCSWLAARRATDTTAENSEALRAVAVDGKSLRGSRDANGRRVHLLSAVDHDQAVTLAQRDVDRKTNETGEFKALLAWLDLTDTVVTFDALHTVKEQARWLVEDKGAPSVAIVKRGQKHLYRQLKSLPWVDIRTGDRPGGRSHGRDESHSVKVCGIDPVAGGLPFPGAVTAIKLHRRRKAKGRKESRETVYAVTSLEAHQASPADIAVLVRGQWSIEKQGPPRPRHHLRQGRFPAPDQSRTACHSDLPQTRHRRTPALRSHQPRQSHPDQHL